MLLTNYLTNLIAHNYILQYVYSAKQLVQIFFVIILYIPLILLRPVGPRHLKCLFSLPSIKSLPAPAVGDCAKACNAVRALSPSFDLRNQQNILPFILHLTSPLSITQR